MKKALIKIVATALSFAPVAVFAQGAIPPLTSSGGVNLQSTGQLGSLLQTLARFFGTLIMAIAVFMILYAGFKFVTSGDNEESVGQARTMLTYGVIGIIVALIAFSVPALVASVLGGTVLQ